MSVGVTGEKKVDSMEYQMVYLLVAEMAAWKASTLVVDWAGT